MCFARKAADTPLSSVWALLISLFVFAYRAPLRAPSLRAREGFPVSRVFDFSHLSGTFTAWALHTPGRALELPPPVNLALPLLTPRCRPDQSRAPLHTLYSDLSEVMYELSGTSERAPHAIGTLCIVQSVCMRRRPEDLH